MCCHYFAMLLYVCVQEVELRVSLAQLPMEAIFVHCTAGPSGYFSSIIWITALTHHTVHDILRARAVSGLLEAHDRGVNAMGLDG